MSSPLLVGWYGPSDGPWGWIQSHFEHISLLERDSLEDWWIAPRKREATRCKVLVVAMEHRSDAANLASIQSRILPATTSKPNMPVAMVLGNDWHGHRRTHPLPDNIPTFYWYQWYDRIFPWMTELSQTDAGGDRAVVKRKIPSERSADSIPWRVQWTIERSNWQSAMLQREPAHGALAWIITDHRDQRELWKDACDGVGMRVVASRVGDDPPWLEPQLIVIDCVSRSEECDRAIEQATRSARARHPNAMLAQVASFPTWDQWSRWRSQGVDAILPRPAALQGFLFYWRQWVARTAV